MKHLIKKEKNIFCLDGDIIEIEGIKFGGCNSWYDDSYVKKYFKEVCSIDDKIKGLPNIPKEYLPDFKLVVNKAIIPTDKELENNNRARSAKLRIIERVK